MVWVSTPDSSRSFSIFMAVVVLPEPEGPESRMMWDLSRLPAMHLAASSSLRWNSASVPSTKALGSFFASSLMCFSE